MMPSDRPTDDIIDNDAKLDRWWDNYLREASKKPGKASTLDLYGRDKHDLVHNLGEDNPPHANPH